MPTRSPVFGPTTPSLAGSGPPPGTGPALVELEGVSKSFETGPRARLRVLSDLHLSLGAGSATLIRGPSGSGKTTLLGLIGCMVRPTAGRIRLDGQDVTRLPEALLARLRRWRFGFVFQSHHLISGLSALTNVMLPALPCAPTRPRALPRGDRGESRGGHGEDGDLRERARALLARFGLEDRTGERVEHLSGGERQRVAIARALINDPPILLADEPTAWLDASTASPFLDLLAGFREEGRAVIVASHDPLLVNGGTFARILALREGCLLEDDGRPAVGRVLAFPNVAGERRCS